MILTLCTLTSGYPEMAYKPFYTDICIWWPDAAGIYADKRHAQHESKNCNKLLWPLLSADVLVVQVFSPVCHYWKPVSENIQLHNSEHAFKRDVLSCCLPGQARSLLVACLTSQQHASVSQGRICSDKFMCCHIEIEVADQTFYLTQSQYTDTGPTSPSTDPLTPDAWQGSHWGASFWVTGMTWSQKHPGTSGIRTRDLPLSRRTP